MGYLTTSPNRLSILILAQYDNRGKIAYAGLVGTGLSREARGMLLRQFHALKRKTRPRTLWLHASLLDEARRLWEQMAAELGYRPLTPFEEPQEKS